MERAITDAEVDDAEGEEAAEICAEPMTVTASVSADAVAAAGEPERRSMNQSSTAAELSSILWTDGLETDELLLEMMLLVEVMVLWVLSTMLSRAKLSSMLTDRDGLSEPPAAGLLSPPVKEGQQSPPVRSGECAHQGNRR